MKTIWDSNMDFKTHLTGILDNMNKRILERYLVKLQTWGFLELASLDIIFLQIEILWSFCDMETSSKLLTSSRMYRCLLPISLKNYFSCWNVNFIWIVAQPKSFVKFLVFWRTNIGDIFFLCDVWMNWITKQFSNRK